MNSLSALEERNKHIVVVLGMHRSGTSLLTRGLQVLGVELGDNLFGGIIGNNDKGFFEDVDVNGFNVQFLQALGRDWHSLEPIRLEEFDGPAAQEFKLKAIDLLRNKIKITQCFGLKDPRIARLLPFWMSVFDHLKVRVSYIIAFRNPMSVARSLQRRDGFDLEKGYFLWQEHMLGSLGCTAGCERLVVEYDRLIADPAHELQRIASVFNLAFDPMSQEFSEYKIEFLDRSLRHTEYQAEDLLLEQAAPSGTVELYELLVKLSRDASTFDAKQVKFSLDRLIQQLRNSHKLLRYLSRKDAEFFTLAKTVSENDGRLSSLQQAVVERDSRIGSLHETLTLHADNISNLNKELTDRDIQISFLRQSVTERDARIGSLHETVSLHTDSIGNLSKELAERDAQNFSLSQVVTERDNHIGSLHEAVLLHADSIGNLNKELAARDTQIFSLSQTVTERAAHIGGLSQLVTERDQKIDTLNQVVSGESLINANARLVIASLENKLEIALVEAKNQQLELASRDREIDQKQVSLQKSIETNMALEARAELNHSAFEKIVAQRAGLENKMVRMQEEYESNINHMRVKLEMASSEINNLADLNVKSSQEVSRLNAELEQVSSRCENLNFKLEEYRGGIAEMKLANERHMAEIARLEIEIERKSRAHTNSVDDCTALSIKNEQLNLELFARTQHVAHLESACAAFKYEVSTLETNIYYACQEIEVLKNANAEACFYNERILKSSSWYLTAPLRFFRLNFMTRPSIFIKKAIVQSGRGVWRSLPISTNTRLKCKSALYKTLPFAFKNSEKYQQWKFYLDSQKKHAGLQCQEQITPMLSSPLKPVAEIPRIQFDSTQNQFVEYRDNPAIEPVVKLIAFYLPQFHPFPENDAWWGKGFTEWTNVTKAYPNYVEHYQPHYPIHMGYYDLRVAEAMEEQARLAKEYGIYGFSYYFYWFAGKILMDTPLEQMLANPKVDMPFCFTWANENWSRRWDGQENDILIAQHHSDEDSIDFIRHLFKYFKDDRYIKIDGKPLLIIYRANIIPNIEKTADIWRNELERNGFPGVYLVCAQSFGIKSPAEFGFDASVEFPPHTVSSTDVRHELNMTNSDFSGHVFSYEQVVANAVASKEPDYKLFRAAMLSWDNTARKQHNSHIFHGFSLLRYKQWLSAITNNVFNNAKYSKDEKLVFVNAWNEWAEGTHLEPDRRFGYGYLQATYDVLAEYDLPKVSRLARKRTTRQNDCAVILHLHYEELWSDIKQYLDSLGEMGFDLYVTVTSSAAGVKVVKDYPSAHVELVENRGRDILPFLGVLELIKDMGYVAVCKIHSKRSVYRQDGDKIRDELLDALLGSNLVASQIIERFSLQPSLGLIAAEKYLIPHTDHNMTFSGEVVARLSLKLDLDFSYDEFAAGSMFWFKPEALESILSIEESLFEVEEGLADGTLAHGVERIICSVIKNAKYSVETV